MKISEVGQGDFKNVIVSFSQTTDVEESKLKRVAKGVNCRLDKYLGSCFISFSLPELRQFINECQKLYYFQDEIGTLTQIQKGKELHFKGKNFDFDLTLEPIIYSIVNCTPDSYYDGNKYNQVPAALKKIESDLIHGAAVIELGGKSTRPDFKEISPETEWQRLAPTIKAVRKEYPNVVLAIDTDCAYVMKRALDEYGVDIINDVYGFDNQEKLAVISEYQPSLIVMNNGRNNRKNEVFKLKCAFQERLAEIISSGIDKEQIVIDAGVGFSLNGSPREDMVRIKLTRQLRELDFPLMIAISRKSFMGKLFDIDIKDRLAGTILFESLMIQNGGNVLRVHDVKETKQMLEMLKYYESITLEDFNGNF
ncbi:MAG: dihydropteroate synthase [Streptococcaceae bacterium]|jgi:dihydropteroate synthase|nr:dihydropteroate synthase [Streptococcaceae bacterium]